MNEYHNHLVHFSDLRETPQPGEYNRGCESWKRQFGLEASTNQHRLKGRKVSSQSVLWDPLIFEYVQDVLRWWSWMIKISSIALYIRGLRSFWPSHIPFYVSNIWRLAHLQAKQRLAASSDGRNVLDISLKRRIEQLQQFWRRRKACTQSWSQIIWSLYCIFIVFIRF